jgi:RimJ/RimL family protein N-acetyltransferase
MNNIILKNITENDKEDLYKIVSNHKIMKYVGDRKIWNKEKLNNFIKYKEEDKNNKDILYCKIENKQKQLIGVVGIHKYPNEKIYSITQFLDSKYQGKNIGTLSGKKIINKFINYNPNIKNIYSIILVKNIKAQKSAEKVGFIFDDIIQIHNKTYKKFIYVVKYHNILKLEYPYMNIFITKNEILNKFRLLQEYKPDIKDGNINKFTNKMKIIIDYNKEKHINTITNYYTDKCRVRCIFKHYKLSQLDVYNKKKGYLIKKSIIDNKFNITKFEENMFNIKYTKFCNNFQCTLAYTIYKIFNARNILDSSAGWGDRLIAAIAVGANYTGYDPSICLKPLYKNIIKDLCEENNKKNYNIISQPFEEVIIKQEYDVVLTSPPFFDLEIYEDNKQQSIVKYPSEDGWLKNFLLVLVDKNIDGLITGGYLIMYIPHYPVFMKYMNNNIKVKYIGELFFITSKSRSILVWKKL